MVRVKLPEAWFLHSTERSSAPDHRACSADGNAWITNREYIDVQNDNESISNNGFRSRRSTLDIPSAFQVGLTMLCNVDIQTTHSSEGGAQNK
jgi:hypothetical protein